MSEIKQGLLTGLFFAVIAGVGYYLMNQDLAKSIFVSATGLAVSILIFGVFWFFGKK